MSEPILKVSNLSAYYSNKSGIFTRKNSRKKILDGINFEIYPNETVGLVGESGCGKTTLAKCILGMNTDIEGEIINHTKLPQMVFQDPYSSLNPARKIGWILSEPLVIQGIPKEERKIRVEKILSEIGLEGSYSQRYPSDLSGGQRQRIAIAAAIIANPSLVIADEPVSALDVTVQAQILSLLGKLKESHDLSYLFISHDLNVVYNFCDRVMVMKGGKIIEQNYTEEIFNNPQQEYTKKLLSTT